MKREKHFAAFLMMIIMTGVISCEGSLENGNGSAKPKPGADTYDREVEIGEPDNYEYPEAGTECIYTPSLNQNKYRPIMVKNSSAFPPNITWTQSATRIVHYMSGYETETKTYEKYRSMTNKYGSTKTKPRQQATGRFHTKKVDGRWWIVDPEGYLHFERGVTSVRYGSSDRNKVAWNERFGSDTEWMAVTRRELALLGIHGTGAFCTDTYTKIIAHNTANPASPMTLAPSFGFLSAFKSKNGHEWPGGNSDLKAALVFHEDWPAFCKDYVKDALAPYLFNANVLGIFSDNEINFSTYSKKLLTAFLEVSDVNDVARKAADAFMAEKGAVTVTEELNSEFSGMVAEKYYKAVKEALAAADPGMLYLGTRLHGTPKYTEGVIKAAGKWCDIISINYYGRWSPELDSWVRKWGQLADKPFLVTEFYTKGIEDSDLNNQSGAGWAVPTQKERAYAYQHFTLGLLEAKNCVGWHWFKYQDDDGTDNSGKPANKGLYDNYYVQYPILARFMKEVNYNVYDLINYFDKTGPFAK